MAKIPNLPNEDNMDTLHDVEGQMRKMNDILLTHQKLNESILVCSKEEALIMEERLIFAREATKVNLEDLAVLQEKIFLSKAAVTDLEKDLARAGIEGIRQRISNHQKEAEMALSLNKLQLEMAEKRYKEEHKWQEFSKGLLKDVFGLNVGVYDTAKKYGDELSKYPFSLRKMAYVWGTIISLIKTAFENFKVFDTAAAKFRIEMGMVRDNAKQLRAIAEQTAIQFMHVGVTIDSAYKAISALRVSMGSAHIITKDMVKDVAVMSSQLGVSEENSAKFMRNMAAVSGTTMKSQQNLMFIAAHMSEAAGVPLNEVMGDIAGATGPTVTMMSRLPNVVLRTAIEARRLGTTLESMAKSSRTMLDFQESVNAEMDASVLIGRSINLQRARELAYRKDLEGSTKEILRLTKEVDFENLDVFQQEAFAKATGRSVEELLKMTQAEKEWDKARSSSDPKVRSMVENYEKMRNASQASIQSESEKLKLMVMQKSNQDRMAAITQKWNQLLAKATNFLFPIFDLILSIADVLTGWAPQIMAFIGPLGSGLALLGEWIKPSFVIADLFSRIGFFVFNLGPKFAAIGTKIVSIGATLTEWVPKVLGMFGKIGPFLGAFGKFIPIFGWVITAFQAISGAIDGWTSTAGTFGDKFVGAIRGIFKSLIPGGEWILGLFDKVNDATGGWLGSVIKLMSPLYWIASILDGSILESFESIGLAFIKPFQDAWEWIKGIFVGNSPSKMALGILNGMESIGPMLFDAITGPFRNGLAWIMDKIPGMGSIAEKLRGGVSGAMDSVEKRISDASASSTITPGVAKVEGSNDKASSKDTQNKEEASATDKTMASILEAINTLNANLMSGKVAVYLDGQLVSVSLARQTSFHGGYGSNKIE